MMASIKLPPVTIVCHLDGEIKGTVVVENQDILEEMLCSGLKEVIQEQLEGIPRFFRVWHDDGSQLVSSKDEMSLRAVDCCISRIGTAEYSVELASIAGAAIKSKSPLRLKKKHSQVVLIEGHMEKRGVYNTNWARRFFRLDTVSAELDYYESNVAFENFAKPKGMIPLSEATEIRGISAEDRTIDIVMPSRTYSLRTPPENHTDGPGFFEWLSHLKETFAEAKPQMVKGRRRRSQISIRSVLGVLDPAMRSTSGRSLGVSSGPKFSVPTLILPGEFSRHRTKAGALKRDYSKLRLLKESKLSSNSSEDSDNILNRLNISAPDKDDVARAALETVSESRLRQVSLRLEGSVEEIEALATRTEQTTAEGVVDPAIILLPWARDHFAVPGFTPGHASVNPTPKETDTSASEDRNMAAPSFKAEHGKNSSKDDYLLPRIRWQDSLLTSPLHDFSPESAKVATQFFRNVTGFMKDRKSSLSVVEHVAKLLRNAMRAPERLQTELFCQVIKQTSMCPHVHRASPNERINENCIRGWQLMAVLVTMVRPQRAFFPVLLDYIKANERAQSAEVRKLVKYSHVALVSTKGARVRTAVPMLAEIMAVMNQDLLTVQVEMINGRRVACKIASWVTVKDLCDQISEQLGVHHYNLECFSLFEGIVDEAPAAGHGSAPTPELTQLGPDDFVADIIAKWQEDYVALGGTTQKNALKPGTLRLPHHYLCHRVALFIDAGKDLVAKSLFYLQALADLVDSVCVLPDDVTFRLVALGLYYVHDAEEDFAQRMSSEEDDIKVHECYAFLPERFLFPVPRRVQSLSRIIEELRYVRGMHLRQQAPSAFMQLAVKSKVLLGRRWKASPGSTHILPSSVLICVHPLGISFLHPSTMQILLSFSFYFIVSWGASAKGFVLTCQRESNSLRMAFEVDEPQEIVRALEQLSDAQLNGKSIDKWPNVPPATLSLPSTALQ